jgi:hypothetical protein
MAISEDLKNELLKLGQNPSQKELCERLFHLLKRKEIARQDLLEFLNFIYVPKSYESSGVLANRLGVKLCADAELKELAPHLFRLASTKGDGQGAYNYARCLFFGHFSQARNISSALNYANLAISRNIDCHYIKAEALWEQGEENYFEAIKAYSQVKKTSLKYGDRTDWHFAKEELQDILNKLSEELDELDGKPVDLIEMKRINAWAEQALKFDDPTIKSHCYFIMGVSFYNLAQFQNAMSCFIEISASSSFYEKSTSFKHDCYRRTIAKHLAISESDEDNLLEASSAADKSKPIVIEFPDGAKGKPRFDKAWQKRDECYDVLNTKVSHKVEKEWQELLGLTQKELIGKSTFLGKRKRQYESAGILVRGDARSLKMDKKITHIMAKQQAFDKEVEIFNEIAESNRPLKKAKLRRVAAEERFFQPKRSQKQDEIRSLTEQVLQARFIEKLGGMAAKPSVELFGYNARQLITAERCFQEAALSLCSSSQAEVKLGIPCFSNEIMRGAGPVETYFAAEYKINMVHGIAPDRDRLGNTKVLGLGNYDDLYNMLDSISLGNKSLEKKLAVLMIRFSHDFKPASLSELQACNPSVTSDIAAKFNQLCLLISAKEQSQWMSCSAKYQTGLAVAQARCLILLREGYLSFKEVFKRSAEYGVFSQKWMLKDFASVESAVDKVEKLYTEYLKHHRFKDQLAFLTAHPEHHMVLSRKQAYQDLLEVYGGESDTDGEGYDTDLSYGSN